MEKEYITKYPTIELGQRDLTQALTSMLNCRRYLGSLGLSEIVASHYYLKDISIGGGYGKIMFPDGSGVNDEDFKKSNNRDSLIERMISKKVIFVSGSAYDNEERSQVVRTTFGDDAYCFFLSVIDTTKEKAGFPLRLFKSKPEWFANGVHIKLRKQIITDQDLENFTKYQQGIEEVMKQDSLLIYSSQVPQRKRTNPQKVDVPKVESNFINPWEINIPKIKDK